MALLHAGGWLQVTIPAAGDAEQAAASSPASAVPVLPGPTRLCPIPAEILGSSLTIPSAGGAGAGLRPPHLCGEVDQLRERLLVPLAALQEIQEAPCGVGRERLRAPGAEHNVVTHSGGTPEPPSHYHGLG